MNLLALSLVFTLLFAAQVRSPSPLAGTQQNLKDEDVVVKEGLRVIVVESYDEQGQHLTKISISPPQDPISTASDGRFPSGYIHDGKEKVKQAAHGISSFPDSGISDGADLGPITCDAFGKCAHRIAGAIGKGKDNICEKAQEAVDEKKEIAHEAIEVAQKEITRKKRLVHEAKEKVEGAYEKAKETATRKAHEAKQAVEGGYKETKECATQKVENVKEAAKLAADAYEKAKESTVHRVQEVKKNAKAAKALGKTIRLHVAGNVTREFGKLKEITAQAKSRMFRFFSYMSSPEGFNSLIGVVNLVGFSTAYGMCVWVTFISSNVLGAALTSDQFRIVQSKIYPVYYRALAYCIGAALLGHSIGKRKKLFNMKGEMFQALNLLVSIMVVLINGVYLEPLATKVMIEKLKMEKEEGRGEEEAATEATITENPEKLERSLRMVTLNQRLKKINMYTSLLNGLILMALCGHSVYLGQSI